MAKSLFISYDGLTDALGQSQVLPYLVGLSNKGHKISIISCEKPDAFQKRKIEIQKIIDENSLNWYPLMYHKSPPIFSTLYDVFNIKRKAKELQIKNKFDIVHCRSYLAALTGLWLKKKHGVKMIFDMRGFWADERVDGKLWSLSNPLYKTIYQFFKRKEKDFFQQSDHVISLTFNGKNTISSGELGYKVSTPITVIPCCVDLNLFRFQANIRKSDNHYLLSYIGSIGTWYMLSEMLDFFNELRIVKPNAQFLFVTREPKEWIENECIKKNIPKELIKIISAERSEVPQLISESNASIFFIKPVFSKKASSPTKQGEIMAMGVPIICNSAIGDTDYVIKKYDSGVVVNKFNKAAYRKAVDELISIPFSISNITNGAHEFYSLENGVENYHQVYQTLTK